MKIGILALQGGFAKHKDVLNQLDVESVEVRLPKQLDEIDALILPGGESTTNIKLIKSFDLFEPISQFATSKPMFGTCAGSILMGSSATNFEYPTFKLIETKVHRNAYGTQVDSFQESINFQGQQIEAMFIRAPKFSDLGSDVEILSRIGNDPIIVRNEHHMMATCHPELCGETAVHEYFIREFVR